jgi:hypothetical protein
MSTTWDTYVAALKAYADASKALDTAAETLRASLLDHLKAHHGIIFNETVVRWDTNKRGVICGLGSDRWTSSTRIRNPDDLPWITVRPLKKNGTPADKLVTVYRDWAVEPQENQL